jgi:hypothetical protein
VVEFPFPAWATRPSELAPRAELLSRAALPDAGGVDDPFAGLS